MMRRFSRLFFENRQTGAIKSPADEIATVHRMLDKHSLPRDHSGQALSLHGRVQEFAFMAAGGAARLARRAG
jgi:hypothetical protein